MVHANIADRDSVKAMLTEVNEKMGRLDYLILNAAKAPFKPIEKLFERELRQLVDTNYIGNIFCIQAALPMLEKTEGKIIFISSLGSRFYNPLYPLGSMKAAMESVVRDCGESLRSKKYICKRGMRWYRQDRFFQGIASILGQYRYAPSRPVC